LQLTPSHAGKIGADTLVVLGLKPGTTYEYQVETFAGGVPGSSPTARFKTGDLPDDLAAVELVKISGSTLRYTVTGVQTASGGYAVAFDPNGRIAWYHDFTATGLQVSDVMMQPNGNFTAFIGNTSGFQPLEGYYVEFTPAGKEVRTYRAHGGVYVDDHEIRLTGTGTEKKAHYMTYTFRTLDLTSIGGLGEVETAGHQIVRENAAGTIEFAWDAWDTIDVEEWAGDDNAKQTRTTTDFDHPNALSFDADGNYIVSWRNLDQIMAINSQTGAIIWRIGGVLGNYQFVNDPLGGFRKQHSPTLLANGNLLVYDNGTGHNPQDTRAVEYKLDHTAKTATMVWEYRHNPPIYTAFVGWVERLASGNTWVGFSLAGRAVEVDPTGNVVWESQLNVNGSNGSVYRLLPIASLYAFAAP
jgi:arylsulfate sulfotransferase